MMRVANYTEQPAVRVETRAVPLRTEAVSARPPVSPLELNAAETAERTKMIAGKWKSIGETGLTKNPHWGEVRSESALELRSSGVKPGEMGTLDAARVEMQQLMAKARAMGYRPDKGEPLGSYLDRVAKEMASPMSDKQLVDRSATMWNSLGSQITERGALQPIPTAEGFLTKKILPGMESTPAGKEFLQVQRVMKGIYAHTGVAPARGEDVQAYAQRAIRVQLQKTPTLHADMLMAPKAPTPQIATETPRATIASTPERMSSATRPLVEIQRDIDGVERIQKKLDSLTAQAEESSKTTREMLAQVGEIKAEVIKRESTDIWSKRMMDIARSGYGDNRNWGKVRDEFPSDILKQSYDRPMAGDQTIEGAKWVMKNQLRKLEDMGITPRINETSGQFLDRVSNEIRVDPTPQELANRASRLWTELEMGTGKPSLGDSVEGKTVDSLLRGKFAEGREYDKFGHDVWKNMIMRLVSQSGLEPNPGETVSAFGERALAAIIKKDPLISEKDILR